MKKWLLGISFVLLVQPIMVNGADFVFGYGIGRSFVLSDKRIVEYADPSYYYKPKLNSCQEFSWGLFGKSGKFGITLDVFRQKYQETHYQTWQGGDAIRYSSEDLGYIYCCFGLEFRFFAEKEKRLNPYMNIGLGALLYFNMFDTGPPEYPVTKAIRLSGGVRIKVISPLFINAKTSYYPANSTVSGVIGLEIIN